MEEFDHRRYQKAFIVNHSCLVRKLTAPELVEACFSKEFLTLDEKSEIEIQRTDTQQLNKLLVIFHRRYVIRPGIFREIFGILKEINDNEGGNIFNYVIQSLQETLENPPEFPTFHDHSNEECPGLQLYESIIITTLDVKQILPELISQCVITIEESEAIDNETDFADKARKFLVFLKRRGLDSFQRFIRILHETEVYKELAEKLVSGQESDGLLKVKHYVTREQLPKLLRVLKEQHHSWFQLGVQLSVSMSKLEGIKNQSIGQSPDVCFPRVIDLFLKKTPEKRKWKDIFQALEFIDKNRVKRELIKQGYQPDSVVTIELQKLSTLLKDVVPNWYMFGQSLEIPTSDLKVLRDGKGSDQCFSQMMDEWMEGEHATFETLIEALEHIGNGRLAREVKETYLTSTQAPAPVPQPTWCDNIDNGELTYDSDEIHDIVKAVFPVNNWEDLGLALKIKAPILDAIKSDYQGIIAECRREMIIRWLREGNASWKELCLALAEEYVGHINLAKQIADQHRISQPTLEHLVSILDF